MTAKTSIDELVWNYYIIYYYHVGKDNKKVNKSTRLHDNKFLEDWEGLEGLEGLEGGEA